MSEDTVKDDTGCGVAIFETILGLALVLPLLWYEGFVVRKLWLDFITPLNLTNGFVPSIYTIVGVLIFFRACVPRQLIFKNSKGYGTVSNEAITVFHFSVLWGFGTLWHWAQWGL